MKLQYRVITYDDDENKQDVTFKSRELAMSFARSQRYSTIFSI